MKISERDIQNLPLISIVLCTYNGEKYLQKQLDSLFLQTYPNLEIIAVDDCSSDSTLDILHQNATLYKNIRIERNVVNKGFLRNFESAISRCCGIYIAPCDQDDVWNLEKIEILYNSIEQYSVAYCDSSLTDESGIETGMKMSDIYTMKTLNDPMGFVMSNCISGHAMLFRRDLFDDEFLVPNGFFHDWWIAAVASSRRGAVYVPKPLVKYRQHAAAVTDIIGNKKTRRSRVGRRSRKRIEIGERLAALRVIGGKNKVLIERLFLLWDGQSHKYFCWGLVWFLIRYRESLWSLENRTKWWRIRRPFRYLLGKRWRQYNK